MPLPIEEVIRRRELPEPLWLRGQPEGRFYADPFPLRRDGERLHILVEEYLYAQRRGRISEIEVSLDGRILAAHERITLPVHASYPFLLRRDDGPRCIPEAFESGRVAAYRWADGADAWTPEAELLAEPLVDSTLVEHDGRWWLFGTRARDEASLYLYLAEDWRGPWRPHPRNPVKVDSASARPAGALVRVDGELYRPSQDCSTYYGAALTINRVLELSPGAFREETFCRFAPRADGAWPDGLHTINGLDGITVVDGLRFEYPAWLGPGRP